MLTVIPEMPWDALGTELSSFEIFHRASSRHQQGCIEHRLAVCHELHFIAYIVSQRFAVDPAQLVLDPSMGHYKSIELR